MQNDNESLHNLLKKYFYSRPEIKLTCTCFHYNSIGDEAEAIVTHKDEQYFKFSSWQDTSGLFLINDGEINRKNYLKLAVDIDIEFADEMTKYDFYEMKEKMIAINKPKDKEMEYTEEICYK